MGEFICHLGMRYYQYADDTQLYIFTSGNDDVDILSHCLEAMSVWMVNKRLQLNSDKTECL